jgi:hypothetical protein
MTYGTIEDLRALKGVVGIDDYRHVLDHAPPGVSDKALLGLLASPVRTLPGPAAVAALHRTQP